MNSNICSQFNLNALSQIYIVSNTPSYLYNKFKKENSIINISKNFKAEAIMKNIQSILKDKAFDMTKMICLYGLIISLTHKPYAEVYKFLSEIKNVKFKWCYEIINIYLQTAEISNFSDLKINIVRPSFNSSGTSQTTENHFDQRIKPKIKLSGE